jgi:riboflavin synthase
MFTGIIESKAILIERIQEGTNIHFWFKSALSDSFKIDQSVAHNGVCLTVVELKPGMHRVTAIEETLNKTNLGALAIDQLVNIERCMAANGRFDGHIVQGHVDGLATFIGIKDCNGSWELTFELASLEQSLLVVEKGSICINGISLTVASCQERNFTVAIIPYTWEHTNLSELNPGKTVNIEFDILGKYIAKQLAFRQ